MNRAVVSTLACMLVSATLFAGERPRVMDLRQDEDWSTLRDPGNRTGALDGLKYIALAEDPVWFLTLGGEARAIYQIFINESFGAVEQDLSGTLLLRLLAHASLNLGNHFRVFLEFNSAYEHGRDGGPRVFDRDDFDLAQGFLEISPRKHIVLRLGRQALHYGAGRMISVREGPSVRRSFDAALLRYKGDRLRVDVFAGLEASVKPEVFDNEYNENQVLWGAYAVLRRAPLKTITIDGYYIGARQAPITYAAVPGQELRHTLGLRPGGKHGDWTWDFEIQYQFGVFKTPAPGSRARPALFNKVHQRIRAGGASASLAYQFSRIAWKPKLILDTGYASGDKDARDDVINTFRAPYPELRFAGTTSSLGPANTMGLNPGLAVFPLPGLFLEITTRFLWRANVRDGLHSPAGFPLRPPVTHRRFIGGGVTLFAAMRWNQYLSSFAMAEYFQPGALLRLRSPGKEAYFFMIGSTFKF